MINAILITILCILIVVNVLIMIYNINRKGKIKQNIEENTDFREKEQQELLKKGFHNVLYDYDIDVALGRREQL